MKQRIKTYLLDLLFILIIISILTIIRDKLKQYLTQLNTLLPQLTNIQSNLQNNNLTTYNPIQIQTQLNTLNQMLDKALFLNKFLLPISIILLWFIIQGLVWKELNNTKFKTFITYTTSLIITFFTTIYFFLSYLWELIYNINANPTLTILLTIITLIISYFTFQSLSNNKPSFKIKAIPLFLLFSLTSFLLLTLLTLTYIFLIVETSIIIPVILIVLLLIAINYQRTYLIKTFKYN